MKLLKKEPYLDESEAQRRQRKKREGLLSGFLILIFGIAIAVLAFILLFHIQKIEVSGNQYCTENEVIAWLQEDKYASNSLYVWAKYNYADVEQLPLVEESEVSLKNPWTIQVRVYEKSIIGYLEVSGQFIYFDKDGVVVIMSDQASLEGVPKIEGIEVALSEVKAHEQLPVKDEKIFASILEVTQEVQKCELTPDRIVFEGADVTLYFGNITVLLGNDNMDDKIAQIGPILEKISEQYPDTSGTLHLEKYSKTNSAVSFVPDKEEEAEDTPDDGEDTQDGTDSYDDDYDSDDYDSYNDADYYGDGYDDNYYDDNYYDDDYDNYYDDDYYDDYY